MKYIVVGSLDPSPDAASANALALAHALLSVGDVVYIHDDLALPPAESRNIAFVRVNDFERNIAIYTDHKRMYCLGNHYTSLFALNLLRKYPGALITTDGSYHDLILSMFQAQKDWPENYADWLMATCGGDGTVIARTLMQHRRLSNAIGSEILDQSPLSLESHPCLQLPANQLFPLISEAREKTPSVNTNVLCIGLDLGTITVINSDLENLDHTLRLEATPENAADIEAQISAAPIVVLAASGAPSPALSSCLKNGKAVIIAGHTWDNVLTDGCCLSADNASARHQIIAAVAAIAMNADLRTKLQNAAHNLWKKSQSAISLDDIITLTTGQPSITSAQIKKNAPMNVTSYGGSSVPQALMEGGASVPVALIGSVPSPALVKTILPGIDPECCPRFATPDLARALMTALSDHGPEGANSLLAHLGFETPIISPNRSLNNDEHSALHHVQNWSSIKQGLRHPDSAVAFNTSIEGLPTLNGLDSAELGNRYGTEINFTDSLKPLISKNAVPVFDRVAGTLELPGLFWKLDKAQHCVNCIMIAGIRGRYSICSLSDSGAQSLIIASNTSTEILNQDGAVLNTDTHGILSFTLCSIGKISDERIESMDLLKLLAETPLKLEWSSHD